MYTPGTLLRLAREERKFAISDVKLYAKIRESAIIAMENDDFERFPAAYMQTFLPSYADFLGVSHYKLAEAFKTTLPEYQYLARSLYSRTLQQIAVAQMRAEYERLHPSFSEQVGAWTKKYAAKAVVVLLVGVLGWSAMTSDVSLLGTLFAGRFVATPEEMRGTPFTELTGEPITPATDSGTARSSQQSDKGLPSDAQANMMPDSQPEMKTIHLASLMNVHIDVDAVKAVAFKQTERTTDIVGEVVVRSVDGVMSIEPTNTRMDASHRSISSIAAQMLDRIPQERRAISKVQERLPITEAVIEQLPSFPSAHGQVLVAGIDDSALLHSQAKRMKTTVRILAITSALRHSRTVPDVESVAFKTLPIQPVAYILPQMHPSLEYTLKQRALEPIHIPPFVVPIQLPDADVSSSGTIEQ